RPVFAERGVEAKRRSRHADREIAARAASGDHRARGVEIHGLGRGERRLLAKIDEVVAPVGEMDEHEAAAAEIAAAWVDDGKRIADGDGRIDGVAALLQDFRPDLRGEPLRRYHHAVLRLDGRRRGGWRG